MPTYEYECTNCAYSFEAFQKITDSPLDKCPKCKKKLRRLISSGAGIIFKGSGFYATDYKKKTPRIDNSSSAKPNLCPKLKEGCDSCQHAK